MSSKKVFILGLDGASPDVIESLIDSGRLPAFKRLKEEGTMGRLRTTLPPITGAAWSSFMTGKNPGKHGIFDFIYRKEGTYHLSPINSGRREGRSFWSLGSDGGKKVCIYNVPVTYPPEKINGVMVSGMLTPSNRTDYTQPPGLLKELEQITGGYEIHVTESYSKGGEERFLKHLHEFTRKKMDAIEYLFRREDWDLFVAVLEGTDVIQHELWHCWDPNHFRHDPSEGRYADAIPRFYQEMDDFLRKVMENWLDSQWTLIVMSDHGAGPLEKLLYVNNFLMKKGFLRLKKGIRSSLKHHLFQWGVVPMTFYHLLLWMGLGRFKRKARFGQRENWLRPFFLSFEDVDWNKTVAYSIGSTAGQIYLNLKGREPQGIVQPGAQFERIREEIIRELGELVDEQTGEKVVGEVFRKEEIYSGPHLNEAPDIVFIPRQFEIAAFGEYEFASDQILDYSWGVSGSHRMEGLLMMKGEGIKPGNAIEGAQITDLAPSVLYLLGLPVLKEMDGKILQAAFLNQCIEAEEIHSVEDKPSNSFSQEVYSEKEEEELKRHLRGLGYID